MNKNTLKSTFFAISLILSIICFLYVNLESKDNIQLSTIQNKELTNQQTSMPDLKIVKGVVEIISKFLTAK